MVNISRQWIELAGIAWISELMDKDNQCSIMLNKTPIPKFWNQEDIEKRLEKVKMMVEIKRHLLFK